MQYRDERTLEARLDELLGQMTLAEKAAQMVRDGAIGTIRHFEASYLQSWLTQPAWGHWDREPQWLWRLSTKHGSKGVLGDVGIHILDFAKTGADADTGGFADRHFCSI